MKFRFQFIFPALIIVLVLGLSNSGLHPTTANGGYTGSPVDSGCNECHTGGGNIDGEITISGLPTVIETQQTYPITVTIYNPNGNAARAGFQLVALNGSNGNAGNMTNLSPNTQLSQSGGRAYWGHSPAQNFPSSNTLTFQVDWTAPSSTGSVPEIRFYASSVIANGNGATSGDRVAFTELIVPIMLQQTPLSIDITDIIHPRCFGQSDGQATATASGGMTPYSYEWSNGSTNNMINQLSSGMISVTVTDGQNNTASASTFLTDPPPLSLNLSGSLICASDSSGTVQAMTTGGTGDYTFQWSQGGSESSLSNLSPGIYTVTVTDSNNCQITGETVVESVPEPIYLKEFVHPLCFGNANGAAHINILEGQFPFTYLWSNGSDQPLATSLSEGIYQVTFTDSHQCQYIDEFVLTQPDSITIMVQTDSVSCHGAQDGSMTIEAFGGTPPFTITFPEGTQTQHNPGSIYNLYAGTYYITVSDIGDCQEIFAIEIPEPEQINPLDSISHISCYGRNDGYIGLFPQNLLGNPEYLWSNGANSFFIDSLPPGLYSVTITDSGTGCESVFDFDVTEPDTLSASLISAQPPLCEGGTDGSIYLEVSGGTSPIQFLWSNDSVTQNLIHVSAGIYTVTATDVNGCQDTLTHIIQDPEGFDVQILMNSPATCLTAENGVLAIEASSLHPPINYLWNNGSSESALENLLPGEYQVTLTDSLGCTKTDTFIVETLPSDTLEIMEIVINPCFGDSMARITILDEPFVTYQWLHGPVGHYVENLAAGVYIVTGTDSLGCESHPLEVNITDPPEIKSDIIDSKTLLCPRDTNGYIIVSVSGGTGDLQTTWNTGQSDTVLLNLSPNIYTLNITDDNSCQVQFNYNITEADSIKLDTVIWQNVLCHGDSTGSVILAYSGGYDRLNLVWNDSLLRSDTLTQLSAGIYPFTITDEAQCTFSDTVFIGQPEPVASDEDVTPESQAGLKNGKVQIFPSGGTPPYSIIWNDQNTDFDRMGMAPGVYTYNITDIHGCMYADSVEINGGRCGLRVRFDIRDATCFDFFDGAIDLEVSGNLGEVDIQLLRNGEEIEPRLDSLNMGTYTLIVQDSVGCVSFWTNIVIKSKSPDIIVRDIIVVPSTGPDTSDGSLSVTAEGGTEPLRFEWFISDTLLATGNTVTDIAPGIYKLVITDSNGCFKIIEDIQVGTASLTRDFSQHDIIIRPNPSSDYFEIVVPDGLRFRNIRIVNQIGQTISHFKGSVISDFNSLESLGITHSGIYYIYMTTEDNRVARKKLVVLKS